MGSSFPGVMILISFRDNLGSVRNEAQGLLLELMASFKAGAQVTRASCPEHRFFLPWTGVRALHPSSDRGRSFSASLCANMYVGCLWRG